MSKCVPPLLTVYYKNDDLDATGLQGPTAANLGLGPIWLQNAPPRFKVYYENNDSGGTHLKRDTLANLVLGLIWPQNDPPLSKVYYKNIDLDATGLQHPTTASAVGLPLSCCILFLACITCDTSITHVGYVHTQSARTTRNKMTCSRGALDIQSHYDGVHPHIQNA